MRILQNILTLALAYIPTSFGSQRSLQECTTPEPFNFEGLLIFELAGIPGIISASEVYGFTEAIKAAFGCDEAGSFYYLTNVTVRRDVIDTPDYASGSTVERNFSWPVSITGLANSVSWDRSDIFLDRRRRLEDRISDSNVALRRGGQECACPYPSQEVFLSKLSRRLEWNFPHIDSVRDLLKTEQVDCAADMTIFSNVLAMNIVGNSDLVTNENLGYFAESVLAAWNNCNSVTCDLQFRVMRSAKAMVDLLSIKRGEGTERRLQNETDAPSSSVAPSAASPAPTQAPTTRGSDLFTLLVELEGTCRACRGETDLFDQTDDGNDGRRLEANPSFRELTLLDECICPVDAEDRGPTLEEFFDAWDVERQILGTKLPFFLELKSAEEFKKFDCFDEFNEFVTYSSVQVSGNLGLFIGQEQLRFEETLLAAFNGFKDQFCDPLIRQLTSARAIWVGNVTNAPSSSPSYSAMPSPQPSMEPSQAPSISGRLLVQTRDSASSARDLQSDSGSDQPSIVPSQAPSEVEKSESPTESPTSRGPDLFSILLELRGTCNGCNVDSNLFDDLSGRRALSDHSMQSFAPAFDFTRLLQNENTTKCFCLKEAEERGVYLDEFFKTFREEIEAQGLQSITNVEKAEETKQVPSLSPSLSFAPSANPSSVKTLPSHFPSEYLSMFPSSFPSEFSSKFPSAFPSPSPIQTPAEAPSGSPTDFPSSFPT
jgi:hypothetical protein